MTVKVAVVGASGYAGCELFRLLAGHPKVKLIGAYDIRNAGKPVSEVHPNLRGIVDLKITEPDYAGMGRRADVILAATPHKVAMKFVPKLLGGKAKIIDLSADFRFDDVKVYESYYVKHESPEVKGVFGLPELYRAKIRRARLVANPGCFPTAAILSLAPLVKRRLIDLDHIVIDAKTGTSGAGAAPSEVTHHPVAGANIRAYAATTHRHSPEIDQELSKLAGRKVKAHFTPHLIPIVRGILSTAHVFLRKPMTQKALLRTYREFYAREPFVRVLDELPQVNFVVGSNYCDIGLEPDPQSNRLVVVAAIDNLIKGASGQAIQCMNLMFGFDETEGLGAPALRP
ncbi:MAG: N-acetyl-gamma-glutamyl-phosphate reductase [Hadesarchaea archaeon]|nr:N-acetyl-gamma-glutamyl-phosphate reductase [Hadesarchaea archaeon]